jgi:hypothetical protein
MDYQRPYSPVIEKGMRRAIEVRVVSIENKRNVSDGAINPHGE